MDRVEVTRNGETDEFSWCLPEGATRFVVW